MQHVHTTWCMRWHAVTALVLLPLIASSASAQLTPGDVDDLRGRAVIEGWTFNIAANEATRRPMSELCGLKIPETYRAERVRPFESTARGWNPPPPAFDWRSLGACTPIRNQGSCGSCWAFATVGIIESNLLITTGTSSDLSEQWLVSCTNAGNCDGGYHIDALEYMRCNGWQDYCGHSGAVLESAFPYVAADAPCGCPYTHPYCINSYSRWIGSTPPVYDLKMFMLRCGPIAVGVHVGPAFQAYSGGVFNSHEGGDLNHSVILVGWDDSQGAGGVWFVRNSWGLYWGESPEGDPWYQGYNGGYMRIEYGCSRIGEHAGYVSSPIADCNGNGIPDTVDVNNLTSPDCNHNWEPDDCEVASGSSPDCNSNGVPDECDLAAGSSDDCNTNSVPDECDMSTGTSDDCNVNGRPDECDLTNQTSADCNLNAVPDECDIGTGISPDCNANGQPDECDLASQTSGDCNSNAVPDECDIDGETSFDCNFNGIPDECDFASGVSTDCNKNGVPDECDVARGASYDCNIDGIPDECEENLDCSASLWLNHTCVAGGFASSADYMTITTTGQAGGIGPQLFASYATSNGFIPVAVNPGWPPVYGDLDCDGDVDTGDLDVMLTCLSGPEVTTPPPSVDPLLFTAADLDGDLDVDMEDVAIFQAITWTP